VAAIDAAALLVQWAPITERVLCTLTDCKVIVRYGIGVDNIDLAAAKRLGIPLQRPDYCIDEVADTRWRMRWPSSPTRPDGPAPAGRGWKITPPARCRRSGHDFRALGSADRPGGARRARAFGFKLAAYDPNLPRKFSARPAFSASRWRRRLPPPTCFPAHAPDPGHPHCSTQAGSRLCDERRSS